MLMTIPSSPTKKTLKNGCFFVYDGRKTMIVGYTGGTELRRYSVSPGERITLEKGILKVMRPPTGELARIAWREGFFGSMRCGVWAEMHEKVFGKTFFDSKWGKMRPTACVQKGAKCAVARCQVPGLDFGKPMFWWAEPDCEPSELERLLKL